VYDSGMEYAFYQDPEVATETDRELTEGFKRGFIIPKSDLELVEKLGQALTRTYDTEYTVVVAEERDQVLDHMSRPLDDGDIRVVVKRTGAEPNLVVRYYNELVKQRLDAIRFDGADPETANTVLLMQLDRIGRNRR
jgi:hypothetical protein